MRVLACCCCVQPPQGWLKRKPRGVSGPITAVQLREKSRSPALPGLLVAVPVNTGRPPAPKRISASRRDGFTGYVGCGLTPRTVPSHAYQRGKGVGAFFESPGAPVVYDVCLTFPSGREVCARNQEAAADTLYLNRLPVDGIGAYRVAWFVDGVQGI